MTEKILVIVESPAKGRKIEHYLGKNYRVMATRGHIADLSKGGKSKLGIDIENGFKPRYALLDDKVDLVNDLIKAAEESDKILLASDPDREGEAIAWHVASKLAKTGKDIKRVEFHEITKKGVDAGINAPRELNLNLFKSQEARRVLDRIVGFMASPFLMNFFGPNLSAGRVQSVVTKMIVDREQEIDVFVPEEYFVIKTNLTKDKKLNFGAKYDKKVTEQDKADEIVKDLKSDEFIVTQVLAAEELKKTVPPLITAQLQKVMAKSFGFGADKTMKAAQSLYESGHVTYIRTDSVRCDPDAVKSLREWLTDNKYEIPKTANAFKTKNAAQDAHECIRPTDLTLTPDNDELTGDNKLVYSVIWKFFVASQMMPAVYDTLKVTIETKKTKHVLKASGKSLKKQGFLEIIGITDDSKIDIPNLFKDDVLELFNKKSVTSEKKQTQPPARYTNYTLIENMEKKNIGRPATYAEVISKISTRNYVELQNNSYHATDLGKQVTQALNKFFSFMAYDYTANMEEKLDDVEAGKHNQTKMLEDFFGPFKAELQKAYIANGSTICDKCGSPMVTRQYKNSKFLGCSAYPNCKSTKNL